MKNFYILCLACINCFLSGITTVFAQVSQEDYDALVAFYISTNGSEWTDNTGWDTSENNVSNSWFGITVSGGRVVGINMPDNNLQGTIPIEIGNLTKLTVLNLKKNLLTDTIPVELGQLTQLTTLNLYKNELSGEIPAELGNLTNLELLNLGVNNLTGELPAELANLTNLEELVLSCNQLSGDMPTGYSNLSSLSYLDISNNEITSLADFSTTSIVVGYGLIVDNNYLGFESLELNNAKLDASVQDLTQTTQVVSGTIKNVSIGDALTIQVDDEGADSHYSWMKTGDGTIGSDSPKLEFSSIALDDAGYYICEVTNDNYSGLTFTTDNIHINFIPEFTTEIITNAVTNNVYTYNITVTDLDSDDNITINCTDIPAGLSITYMSNGKSVIKGEPQNVGTAGNTLTIEANDGYTTISQTAVINVTKQIRQSDFDALVALYNATDGDNWTDNTGWNTTVNNVGNSWYGVEVAVREGRVISLLLGDNNLQGYIPAEIGVLDSLQNLDLQSNSLSCDIPEGMGDMVNLETLNLFSSGFTGIIPESFGNLTELVTLTLQENNFTGAIPETFKNLTSLVRFVMYSNQFEDLSDLSGLTNLTNFQVQDNQFLFDDLEPNYEVLTNYSPQPSYGESYTDTVSTDETLILTYNISGVNNRYGWYKRTITDDQQVSLESEYSDYEKTNCTEDVGGEYVCKTTNTLLPDLTIESNAIYVYFNHKPEFTFTPVTTADEDALYTCNITVSDEDGDGLVITCDEKPSWLSFTFDGNTTASVSGIPLNEDVGKHTLSFSLTDGIALQTVVYSFSITVSNTNDPPTAITLSNQSVDENKADEYVGTFSTIDEDSEDTYKYTFVSGNNDNGMFTLNSGGKLYTATTLDYETRSEYLIKVESTERGADPYSIIYSFKITVNDINDSPTAISLSNTSVDENTSTGGFIATLSATDQDNGDIHTFSLNGSEKGDNAYIQISGNSILLKKEVDYEQKQKLTVYLMVTDLDSATFKQSFEITVNDINEAPGNIRLSNNTVAENQASGTVVGYFSADDEDPGDSHEFDLVIGKGTNYAGNSFFKIINDTTLITRDIFDYETKESYNIYVRVLDKGNLQSEKALTINVSNVNEAPEIVTPDALTVDANTEINLGGILIYDVDAGNNDISVVLSLTYDGELSLPESSLIVSGNQTNRIALKGSRTDINIILQNLIYSGINDFHGDESIKITVSDLGNTGSGGAKTTSANLTVSVLPVPPVVSKHPSPGTTRACAGSDVKLSVTADGILLSYQWRRYGEEIPGANEATYTVESVTREKAGAYDCVVTNPGGCITSDAATILVSPITLSVKKTDVICKGDTSATITINASGGYDSLSCFVDDVSVTAYSTGYSAGTYTVAVLDQNNCTKSKEISIEDGDVPVISTEVDSVLCYGEETGSVIITAEGGAGGYKYSLTNNLTATGKTQYSKKFSNLAVGEYIVTVTDQDECSASVIATVEEPEELTVELNVTAISCNGDDNGEIIAIVSGGTQPYAIMWSNNKTTDTISNLVPDFYSLTLIDENGCTESTYTNLTEPDELTITKTDEQSVICSNSGEGSLTVTASGGTPDYLYSLDNGETQSTGEFFNLDGGSYTARVTDANGCNAERTVKVSAVYYSPEIDFDYVFTLGVVKFFNYSTNYDSCRWDFGDGTFSRWYTEAPYYPVHLYEENGEYKVTLIAISKCETDSLTKTISIVNVSVDQLQETNIAIYPNPAPDYTILKIEGIDQSLLSDGCIKVYNITGELIRVISELQSTNIIDFTEQTNGIYFVHLIIGDAEIVKKVVVY